MPLDALHVTKCRLCGQSQAGREGLCSDCSRALTRARQGSAALKSAPAGSARKARAVSRIVLTSPVEPEKPRQPANGRVVLWAAIGVVAVVLVLGITAGLSPPRTVEPKVLERATKAVLPPLLEPASENEPAESVPAAPNTPLMAAEPPSPPKESKRTSATRPARAAASALASDAKSSPDAASANGAAAPQIEPPVQQARVNVVPSAASGDDDQALARALEKCGEEKFLAGVICEQKVRLRYCEGKWGKVPQCTAKPRVD
jgi:hypothetical protein